VFTYVIDLPVGPGHRLLGWNNGVNRQVFGGWEISGITTVQSGRHSRCITVHRISADSNSVMTGPTSVGTGPLRLDNRNPDFAFDPYISVARPYRNLTALSTVWVRRRPGELARRVATNISVRACPTTISRLPRVSRCVPKGSICGFRADFFNLFNHTNFANPVGNESSGNFGKITATVGSATATAVGTTAGVVGGGPRVIQGALRVEF